MVEDGDLGLVPVGTVGHSGRLFGLLTSVEDGDCSISAGDQQQKAGFDPLTFQHALCDAVDEREEFGASQHFGPLERLRHAVGDLRRQF
jgi:hypothetical protein